MVESAQALVTAKAGVRLSVMAAVRAVPSNFHALLSARATAQLTCLPEWRAARSVALFTSTATELDTDLIIAAARAEGKSILLPAVTGKNAPDMAFRVVMGGEDFRSFARHFGIPQPPADGRDEWPAIACDLVLVPGVAFDRAGGRIGHGRGYYDSFLAGARRRNQNNIVNSSIFAVGLAFDEQIIDSVPMGDMDELLDAVVTPTRIFRRIGDDEGRKL